LAPKVRLSVDLGVDPKHLNNGGNKHAPYFFFLKSEISEDFLVFHYLFVTAATAERAALSVQGPFRSISVPFPYQKLSKMTNIDL
jgi:hypothetical protein